MPVEKSYLDEKEGQPITNLWTDITSLTGAHKERLGFDTQKPQALMERILYLTTDEGDVVMEPFGGTGSMAVACARMGRCCITMDMRDDFVDWITRLWQRVENAPLSSRTKRARFDHDTESSGRR